MSYICYCLIQQSVLDGNGSLNKSSTYVGCTNNFERRIRQHNSEIKGGAKITTRAVAKGAIWVPLIFAKGFIDNHEALSFEWHWKNQSKKLNIKDPEERRKLALDKLLLWSRFLHIVKVEVNNEISNQSITNQTD